MRVEARPAHRTGIEAEVAAEYPVSEPGAKFTGYGATILDGVVADAAASVEDVAATIDSTGRAGNNAADTGSAALQQWCVGRQVDGGGDCAEQYPWAEARDKEHGGLAEPAEARCRRVGTLEERAVVHGGARTGVELLADLLRYPAQGLLENAVVIAATGIAGDPAAGDAITGWRGIGRVVGKGDEDDGAGTAKELRGIGGTGEPGGGDPVHPVEVAGVEGGGRRDARLRQCNRGGNASENDPLGSEECVYPFARRHTPMVARQGAGRSGADVEVVAHVRVDEADEALGDGLLGLDGL